MGISVLSWVNVDGAGEVPDAGGFGLGFWKLVEIDCFHGIWILSRFFYLFLSYFLPEGMTRTKDRIILKRKDEMHDFD